MNLQDLEKYIDTELIDYENKDDKEKDNIKIKVISEMTPYKTETIRNTLKGKIFIVVSQPNSSGFSREVTIDELVAINTGFKTKNGGDWNRSDQSFIGKIYDVKREKVKGSIYSIKLEGFNKQKKINQAIRPDIQKAIQKEKCAILNITTNIECDHKDGMKDNWKLNDKSYQKIDDFQPLSKAANDAKRTHCNRCKKTGKRFDAKELGYSESFTMGDFDSKVCDGCYWFDPKKFNQDISKDFKKKC